MTVKVSPPRSLIPKDLLMGSDGLIDNLPDEFTTDKIDKIINTKIIVLVGQTEILNEQHVDLQPILGLYIGSECAGDKLNIEIRLDLNDALASFRRSALGQKIYVPYVGFDMQTEPFDIKPNNMFEQVSIMIYDVDPDTSMCTLLLKLQQAST